jgi:hypothetical protein
VNSYIITNLQTTLNRLTWLYRKEVLTEAEVDGYLALLKRPGWLNWTSADIDHKYFRAQAIIFEKKQQMMNA